MSGANGIGDPTPLFSHGPEHDDAPSPNLPVPQPDPPVTPQERPAEESPRTEQPATHESAADRDAAAPPASPSPDDAAEQEPPATAEEAVTYPMLDRPADGVPDVVVTERQLMACAAAVARGHGPVALDAERASGYRYGGRAYLVQLRREGSGSWLIDPVACPDLSPLQEAIGDVEWVLHAATQDLPCLAELGLHPHALFDTELGSRLAGLPRVGLAAVVEHYVGVTLAKEHSAVDWSTRPLPDPWLLYAALDVEVLVQVRDRLRADLEQQGKLEWALEEFAALTTFTGPPVRTDPWRRTSGMHRVRDRRAIARVRELWQTRDAIAQDRDTAPGRILPDALIVDLAVRAPENPTTLTDVSPEAAGSASRRGRARPPHRSLARYQRQWLEAIKRVGSLADKELPAATVRSDAPPPQRAWTDRDPVAAARLAQVRDALTLFGEQHQVPVENLITPDTLRRALWQPATEPMPRAEIEAVLTRLGARPWQVQLTAPLIEQAIADHPATDR